MKKFLTLILSLIFAASIGLCVACSCGDFPTISGSEQSALQLETARKTLAVGETFDIKVSGVNGETPTFSSNAESVATVDASGKVSAVSVGNATVTVSLGGQSKNCYIEVIAETNIPVLRLNNVAYKDGQYLLPMGLGDEYSLSVSVLFKGATVDGEINYVSSDKTVATVDNSGDIRAIGAGVATIEVSATYNGRYKDETRTAITVRVSDVSWNISMYDGPLYGISEYKGVTYKHSIDDVSATLTVDNKEYGFDDITVTAGEGGYVEVSGKVITAKKAGRTYVEFSREIDGEKYYTYRYITVNRIDIDMNEDFGFIGYIDKYDGAGKSHSDDEEVRNETWDNDEQVWNLGFSAEIGDLINEIEDLTINGRPVVIKNYDKETYELTFAKSDVRKLDENVKVSGSFESDIATHTFSAYYFDYYLKTADDFTDKFYTEYFDDSEHGGRAWDYYNYIVAEDIDGGTVTNDENWFNRYDGTIDGNGHIIRNLKIDGTGKPSYGLIETIAGNYDRNGGGMTIKDIAFVNMDATRAFIAYTANGITLENVYISGVTGWGELFEEVNEHETLKTVTLKNVILNFTPNPKGNTDAFGIYCTDYGDMSEYISATNVINIATLERKGATFFETYADGLPEEWQGSGFTVDGEGLKFHGKLILASGTIPLTSAYDMTYVYTTNTSSEFVLQNDIDGGTVSGGGTFEGTLDGGGHVLGNVIDAGEWGIMGFAADGATLKDIAIVNLTDSNANLLSYSANDVTVTNAYIGGTCYYHDIFEEVKGTVTLKNVILDCYCVRDGYALGKAGESGADKVIYENVITLDKNDKGAHAGSEYGGTLMTYDEFFSAYGAGLPEEWKNSGFTVDSEGLKFHGALVVERPSV